ncbi:MAG: antitoxin [Candidatus Dormibacteraeota bacterium]|nr:antitoxin [Candidatus Dormibacteraeota bacterium]
MRTTVNLDADVLEVAKAMARTEQRPLGAVISELVRRALQPSAARITLESAFPVFDLPPGTAPLTDEMVRAALEEG